MCSKEANVDSMQCLPPPQLKKKVGGGPVWPVEKGILCNQPQTCTLTNTSQFSESLFGAETHAAEWLLKPAPSPTLLNQPSSTLEDAP